ncbi:Xylosidase/arabinosidase [[Actinomadura] parvosata subsp. kistnae]|uniref:Xylosidase n=1 Tax=[Actinomadura] parvosata subsp. kistnae TaxID=1909395 RepID=A0A1V0A5N0_9ACTN|nr:glycoside hydrolase family 43 protein [Nonomuraea sp. ATCC 55076]AQZ65517.1 xylosidase [Nonomuraea sp. ATCC 55076]SPL96874.1 Xylosidase/arabinosidase [Actinomadura parvosata subsp. kistnae]
MRRRWAAAVAAALLLLLTQARPALAGAPITTAIYTADPAALVVGDTLYLYTGHDEAPPGGTNFVMRDWHVFTSTDAATFTDQGAKLSISNFSWAGADAWAGEVERGADGRYYWYVPVNGNGAGWMDIGVAVGDSPLGPFTDAKGGPLVSDSTPNSSPLNIDPTVFTDDDGQVYMYWGSYYGLRAARLNPNMTSINGSVITPSGVSNFWEAPWMFKRNGVYYLAYAANDSACSAPGYACIRYATASNPLGPWTHRGVVLDQVTSTTNHPAIIEFKGQWYMVYHNASSPGGGNFRRSVTIDKLYFNADGTMRKVVQTGGPTTPGNLAASATPATSYVSPWETLGAIKDGHTPANSQDHSHGAYGNWNHQGTEWIEYQWPTAQTISRSEVYWFDDDQGIDLPASCQLQYWNGSAYVNVPGASGCGVAANAFNATTFTPVSTTRLRLNITSRSGYSTGVLEWRAFA